MKFLNNEELTRSIFADPSKIDWIELDIPFDTSKWAEEAKLIEPHYVKHRGAELHDSWTSCCLHGLGVDKTNGYEFYQRSDTGYDWTTLTEIAPTITQFWKEIFPAESYKRIRFMKLGAGGKIHMHRDCEPEDLNGLDPFEHDLALNLAIVHPNECIMTVDSKQVPWTTGMAVLLNVSKDHEVVNNSPYSRIHMIAHLKVGNRKEEFCKLVADSWRKRND